MKSKQSEKGNELSLGCKTIQLMERFSYAQDTDTLHWKSALRSNNHYISSAVSCKTIAINHVRGRH